MDGSDKHSSMEVAAKGWGRIKGSQSLMFNVSASVFIGHAATLNSGPHGEVGGDWFDSVFLSGVVVESLAGVGWFKSTSTSNSPKGHAGKRLSHSISWQAQPCHSHGSVHSGVVCGSHGGVGWPWFDSELTSHTRPCAYTPRGELGCLTPRAVPYPYNSSIYSADLGLVVVNTNFPFTNCSGKLFFCLLPFLLFLVSPKNLFLIFSEWRRPTGVWHNK